MLLMVNMLGYFLGHYPQHFDLSEEQRNLILQTMMFFFWLAGGGAVFSKVCGWSFVDALYFCDVTILTVGFGDFSAPNDVGRGLVFPFSVGGIIILGLMVSSIRKFAQELGHDKVVKNHVERRRVNTLSRAVTTSFEAEQRNERRKKIPKSGPRPSISAPFSPHKRTIAFDPDLEKAGDLRDTEPSNESTPPLTSPASSRTLGRSMTLTQKIISPMTNSFKVLQPNNRKSKVLILREEKDRFEAMRSIQSATRRFKQYSALMMSIIACKVFESTASLFTTNTLSSRTSLVRRCRCLLASRAEFPRPHIFSSVVFLLRKLAHHRLWGSVAQIQCRQALLHRLVALRRPHDDDSHLGHG